MKAITFTLLITFSTLSFATMEHQEGLGSQPSAERLKKSRGCFYEIQKLGCPHPRDGQEIFNTCLETNYSYLNQTCQAFFKKLYGKRVESEI